MMFYMNGVTSSYSLEPQEEARQKGTCMSLEFKTSFRKPWNINGLLEAKPRMALG